MLNTIGYDGPISVEWEDAGMDRLVGAPEALEFVRRLAFDAPTAAFDAAFLCNSATPVCPITAIDDVAFANDPALLARIEAAWSAQPPQPIATRDDDARDDDDGVSRLGR
jgi:hypothetical protein